MTGMGEMYAHFRSSITAEALEASGVPPIDRKNCMDGVKSPCRIPVSFDFTLAPDYRTINRLGASKIQVFFRIDPYNAA